MNAFKMSDAASGANWALGKSTARRVSLDYGPREGSIGVAYAQATVPLTFTSASCSGCRSQVTAQQAMAHYRVVTPLFGAALFSVTELSVGATRWSELQGQIAPITPTTDLTYGISLGASLPVGDRVELTGLYDASRLKHKAQNITTPGSTSIVTVGLTTLRFGARIRLGK